ncbi:MAG: OPT/YSL family transporter [Gemmatimonadota bacterium]|nr:OPT/YSL family transporter [Gemmatimonadota bacterium]MDQ8175953.1 OPT/YSL family transporter [Gemmatimonadota bacterium]
MPASDTDANVSRMAIEQLTDEQIATWSRRQKDQWWLTRVYRGDMAQLTLRAAITGFLLGGVLSATALYIAGKTGITIGVGVTSVILAFAMFRGLAAAGLAPDYTILENNATQSIATAAGYMVTPLVSGLAAYMLVTGRVVPWWQMMAWNTVISILGVLLAFPMKRRFINEDQLPFPEGRAAGVVLDALYTGQEAAGLFKARLLAAAAAISGGWQLLVSDGWMRLLQFKLLRMDRWTRLTEPFHLQERLDTYFYDLAARYHLWTPKILGTDIRQLGLRLTLDMAMLGVGGLMGIRVATSVLLGAVVNFAVLAPIMIQRGDIAPYTAPDGSVVAISRGEIVNQWALWWGVTMMVVGSLVSLVAKPELLTGLFRAKGASADAGEDPLRDIEVPLWVSYVGVPIFSLLGGWLTHEFFGVPWLLAFVSLPLIFVLTVICTNSMALTSWTPTGALSKITQFTMGAIDRVNPASNLLPATMTAEISSNAANLLSDIKPGYMLGAKPRQQAIGHVIGILAGAAASTPLFFLLFLPKGADGTRSPATLVSEQFAMPSALQWKGVADLITNGISRLPSSAIAAMLVAAVLAVVFETVRIRTKGRFPLSAVSIGLGVVLPPESCFAMWAGAMLFWWQGSRNPAAGSRAHAIWVEGAESVCAGLISGAALVGIGNAILNALM